MARSPQMPSYLIDLWDTRIRQDLQYRIQICDSKWDADELVVRNTDTGFRNGNLVTDFIRMLQVRLFSQPWNVSIRAEDPDFVQRADDAEVVAESVARIAGLSEALLEATKNAMWANTGWMECGHPMDPWSNDVMRSVFSPNVDQQQLVPTQDDQPTDDYVPVSPDELAQQGIQPSNVIPFNPLAPLPEPAEMDDPTPVFDAALGYPWLHAVDPRLIVYAPKARTREGIDYITRMRFLTRPELKRIRGVDYGPGSGTIMSEFREIFQRVEGMDPSAFPELMMICETWIIRDRNNPEYSNWYLCHVMGNKDWVLSNSRNPYGGMIPLIPVKPAKHKAYLDASPAQELITFADMFDVGIKALYRKFLRTLNEKYLTLESAGLSSRDAKNLRNDKYHGEIKVRDMNGVQKFKEEQIDQAFLMYINYIKSLAQAQSGASDIDRGQAVKDISARQTQALLESTGLNTKGMKSEISSSAREAVMKLTYLVGLYNQQARSRKYQVGKRMVVMQMGTHDFTQSFVYDVQITDTEDTDAEKQLSWNQFLRTLTSDTGGILLPYYDPEELARRTAKVMGQDPGLLSARAAGRPGQGRITSSDPQVQAGLLEGGGLSSGGSSGTGASDLTQGQHPERLLGSRGTSLTNAISGMRRIGT